MDTTKVPKRIKQAEVEIKAMKKRLAKHEAEIAILKKLVSRALI
jgi:hypothetical protein